MFARAGKVVQRSCGGGTCTACDDCKNKKLQRSANSAARSTEVPPIVHEVLRTSGTPLDPDTRESLGPYFAGKTLLPVSAGSALSIGDPDSVHEREADRVAAAASLPPRTPTRGARFDFGAIRIHTDDRAAESARAVNARAYTVGTHLVFNTGAYAPRSAGGKRLLVHELTHAVQQEQEVLRRSVTLFKPSTPLTPPVDEATTHRELATSWVETLCPEAKWQFDDKGILTSPERQEFCSAEPTPQHARGRYPASCNCLCDLTAADAPVVRVRVRSKAADKLKRSFRGSVGETKQAKDGSFDVNASAQGAEAEGVGDTSHNDVIPLKSWVTFAHEVCGHVLQWGSKRRSAHAATPKGTHAADASDMTTTDAEDAIQGEHSTSKFDALQGFGSFRVNPNSETDDTFGSYYQTVSGETLENILDRTAIDTSWRNHIFVDDPAEKLGEAAVARPRDPKKKFGDGEWLLIEGIFWHEVRHAKETPYSISLKWGVNVLRLKNANKDKSIDWKKPLPIGTRLLIPHRETCVTSSGKAKPRKSK